VLCDFAKVLTLPNQLTVIRLALTALFVAARESGAPWGAGLAAAAFAAAVLTDYLDGFLARRWRCETDFGRLMDPLADKVLIAAALVCLAAAGDVPAWAAIILIARDFLITGLRQLALSHGTVLAADPAGKTKTASQMVMIGFFLIRDAVGAWTGAEVWPAPVVASGHALVAATVVLSIYSGWRYTRANWQVVVRSGAG
jgi:CDP-diacylglycerol--glycerol-3-phosphate 3-phosphatidyltransferase